MSPTAGLDPKALCERVLREDVRSWLLESENANWLWTVSEQVLGTSL